MPITRVGVVAKSRLSAATPHLVDVETWLAAHGVAAVFETATAALMPENAGRRVADKQSLVNEVASCSSSAATGRFSAWRTPSAAPA